MTSSTPLADSLVYAPLRVRINSVCTAFFIGLMVIVFLGALLSWALDSPRAFLGVALPTVFPTLWAMRRAARVRLVVRKEGVLINNTWRSYKLPWSEVDGVGIRSTGFFPQPVLWFRLVGRSPVIAQATPARRSVRQEFQKRVLEFAPASVQRLEDEVSPSWLGTDSALSYRLRLWWVRKHPHGRWARFLDRFGA
jgi:Bacterial PH domain